MDDLDDDIDFGLGDCDPSRLSVTLGLPDPNHLDDEGMRLWSPRFDGKWSAEVQEAKARFGAVGLDLNRNWASVPPRWSCPVCGRVKRDIVRKADNGILLARLERHHDHLGDLFKRRLKERFGEPWTHAVPEKSRYAEGSIEALVLRFPDVLICGECNAADGAAKNALKGEVHPDFTFTPLEIGRFIRAAPNVLHTIDEEVARTAWREAEEDLRDRLAFMDQMLERMAKGRHGRERHVDYHRETHSWYSAPDIVLAEERNYGPHNAAFRRWWQSLMFDLQARSISNDGAGRVVKAKASKPVRVPTDEEFLTFDRTNSQKGWQRAPADWRCPCCGRGKREVMRWSKSRAWFGQISSHQIYVEEINFENIRFRRRLYPRQTTVPMFGDVFGVPICADCRDVVSDLARTRPDLGSFYLTFDDFKAVIGEVRAHAQHDKDLEAAAERAIHNAPLVGAIAAFEEHRQAATAVSTEFALVSSQFGLGPEQRGWIATKAYEYRVDISGDDPALDWLVKEGQRLSYKHQAVKTGPNLTPGGTGQAQLSY